MVENDKKTVKNVEASKSASTRKSNAGVDMTVGDPTKLILWFSLPVFLGNLFQQFYNLVDTWVVGKFVGEEALAATGTCGSLNFLFFALSSGLAIGIGVITSQFYGAGDEKGVRKSISNAGYVLVFAALLASCIGIFLARPLLQLIDTPKNVLEDAVVYLRTTSYGILFIALYNGIANILRALGDARTPLYFLIISSFFNIGFDLLFVLHFHMGVFGVAFATVIAQMLSAVVSLLFAILRMPYFRLKVSEFKPDWKIIARSFKLGIPIALQSSMIALSLIVLQKVVNGFGDTVMATYTISSKLDVIVSMFYSSMQQSMTTFAGQNLGAGKIDRIRQGFKRGIIMVELYNLIMVPLVFAFSGPITAFFTDVPAVIAIGRKAFRITAVMYLSLGIIYVPRGILNGCGDAKFSFLNGITEVICRIVYANILTRTALGKWGIWYAAGFTWVTVAIVCCLRYYRGKWMTLKRVESN